MKIIAMPKSKNINLNPYNHILYAEIQKRGVIVDEFSLFNVVRYHYDAIHLHWPNYQMRAGVVKAAVFIFVLIMLKFKGSRIVWTIHNIRPHEEGRMYGWQVFIRLVDCVIFLNNSSESEFNSLYPRYRKGRITTKHNLYNEYYLNLSELAKKEVGNLETRTLGRVFTFTGQIRKYKGLEELIRWFNKFSDPNDTLIVRGKTNDPDYFNYISQLSADNERIILEDVFLSDYDLIKAVLASDYMVLPYNKITNSGSALLYLSLGAKIIISDSLISREIQKDFGRSAVHIFNWDDVFIENHRSDYDEPNLIEYRSDIISNRHILAYGGKK